MRKVLITCVPLLGLTAGPLLAQPAAPAGNAAAAPGAPGPGATVAAPEAGARSGGMTGLRPMRGQPREAIGMNHFSRRPPGAAHTTKKRRNGRAAAAGATGDGPAARGTASAQPIASAAITGAAS